MKIMPQHIATCREIGSFRRENFRDRSGNGYRIKEIRSRITFFWQVRCGTAVYGVALFGKVRQCLAWPGKAGEVVHGMVWGGGASYGQALQVSFGGA